MTGLPWSSPEADPLGDLLEAYDRAAAQYDLRLYLQWLNGIEDQARLLMGLPPRQLRPAFLGIVQGYTPPPTLTYDITSTEGISHDDDTRLSHAARLPGERVSYRRPEGI